MMIFIRFLNNKQVEAIQRDASPGADWKAAPADFSWDKRYKLSGNAVTEMTSADLEGEHLASEKNMILETLLHEIQTFLTPSIGNSLAEIQKQTAHVQAATAALEGDEQARTSLTPLADIRGCSVEEVAIQILAQEAEKQRLLILCQAFQDRVALEIPGLETLEALQDYAETFRAQFQAAVGGDSGPPENAHESIEMSTSV
ncbi:hypothetical protein AGMMS49949_09500 [Alphaproteobacteria bacterium]|nr:hypothetical protein AGMMS49949_09500 [Alphaproteobacteria bacterium]